MPLLLLKDCLYCKRYVEHYIVDGQLICKDCKRPERTTPATIFTLIAFALAIITTAILIVL